MSILLGASMLLAIETHEGHYIPKSRDMQTFMGTHYKGAVIPPTGTTKTFKPTTVSAVYTWSVEETWTRPVADCAVIKEVCAQDFQCLWQRLRYRLAPNSPIGEINTVFAMQYSYRSLFDTATGAAIYFHECGGFRAHDVEAKGLMRII